MATPSLAMTMLGDYARLIFIYNDDAGRILQMRLLRLLLRKRLAMTILGRFQDYDKSGSK